MRAYTVATAALALGVPIKWLDNVLSHHRVRGVDPGKQGIQRRIPAESLVILALARAVNRSLGSPLAEALRLAESATGDPDGEVRLTPGDGQVNELRLTADVAAIRGRLEERLREAVEFGATPRRGRPPKRVA